MKKNRKGFTLMELTIVVLILSVLAAIGLPQYRTATKKARIAAYLPIMKTLQDDIINFYNLNGTLPTSLFQLSLNRAEFSHINGQETIAKDNSGCNFHLTGQEDGENVSVSCLNQWRLLYKVQVTNAGIAPSERTFNMLQYDSTLEKAAESFGWEKINSTNYRVN